jgi:hypothetical protein
MANNGESPMTEEQRRRIAQGIAAIVTTQSEMGLTEDEVRRHVLGVMRDVGEDDPAILRDAAEEVTRQPMPPSNPLHQQEKREQVEKMLGLTSVSDQLAAALRAREWLQKWAEGPGPVS